MLVNQAGAFKVLGLVCIEGGLKLIMAENREFPFLIFQWCY